MFELNFLPIDIRGDVAAISSAISWAVCVILMRVAGFHIGVIPLNVFKNTIATVGFVLVVLLSPDIPLLPELTDTDMWMIVLSGLVGVTLADVFFVASLNRLGASSQAAIDCVYAPAVILIAFLMFGETIGTVEIIGGTLVGAAVLLGSFSATEVSSRRSLYEGIAFGVAAHVLMAIGALVIREVYRDISVVWVCAVRFAVANLALIAISKTFRPHTPVFQAFFHWPSLKYTLISSFLGSFLATIFWFTGFKYSVAGRAAIYNQMSSIFIAALGIMFLKEKLTFKKVLAIGFGVAGALIISL